MNVIKGFSIVLSAPAGGQDVASENRLQKYVTLPWVSFAGGGSHSPLGYSLWGKPLHSHWEATGVSLGTHPSATLEHFPFSPDQIATLSQRQSAFLTHRNCELMNVCGFRMPSFWVICYAAEDDWYHARAKPVSGLRYRPGGHSLEIVDTEYHQRLSGFFWKDEDQTLSSVQPFLTWPMPPSPAGMQTSSRTVHHQSHRNAAKSCALYGPPCTYSKRNSCLSSRNPYLLFPPMWSWCPALHSLCRLCVS